MYLKKLELKNYRNYNHISLNFDKSTILILGNNSNGKTNLLESIYYLSTGRSHRTYSQDELINWGSNYSVIRALTGSEKNGEIDHLIEIELKKDNSIKIRVDKVYQRKKSDFISIMPSVIFAPDDLKIIKSGPSDRRNFLDSILDKIYREYYNLRLQYQKILSQRNSLIKSLGSNINVSNNSTLEVWNDNIVRYGIEIIKKRYYLLEDFKEEFKSYMSNFFKDIDIDILYVFSWNREELLDSNNSSSNPGDYSGSGPIENNLKEIFYSKLTENLKKDLLYKTTTVGPHRDDFVILINGKNIRYFGSQGQQRVASISLKFCELHTLKEELKTDPVLLLDDVFSELDMDRRKLLVKVINDRFQTFVTATNISYLDKLDLEFGNKFLVKDNKITALDF